MAEVVNNTPPEFWRPPAVSASSVPLVLGAETCSGCGGEFMIGAKFCHRCGLVRSVQTAAAGLMVSEPSIERLWPKVSAAARVASDRMVDGWLRIPFPGWMRYLHFHEIKRWVGLPTASLIAFIIGLGCVTGAIGISFFYKASTLAEFQAIQLWRIEWLLGATAAFVAGILLKNPSNNE
jgi:hypothetical protein